MFGFLFGRKRTRKDFAAEIQSHLDLEEDQLRAEGLTESEAHRIARVEFGSQPAAEERFYQRSRFEWLDHLLRDLRFSLRSLRQSPGFAITAILTLALGMGANTAVFSVMNAVLLRSLPVHDPQQVVNIRASHSPRHTGTVDSQINVSYAVYDALRHQYDALTSVIAVGRLSTDKLAVRIGDSPEQAEADMVSANFFSGLGVQLIRGHGFSPSDESGHTQVMVVSYNYWLSRFSRDPNILGRTIYVKGVPFTIIGIAAQGFEGTDAGHSMDFWIPLQSRAELNVLGNPPEDGKLYLDNPTWWCLSVLGRLAPGVTREQAVQRLQPIFQTAAYVGLGAPEAGEEVPVLSFADAKNFPGSDGQYGKPLHMLMAMVGLVLLIALTNVVMLLMARNASRQREFSLRLALGASRPELLRQLLMESILLVAAGGALAWLFAQLATRTLARWALIETSLTPDRTVLLVTLAALAIAALLFGLAPFRTATAGGAQLALKTSAATSSADAGRTRTGKIIVAMQMALCVVLLVGGGLLMRTLYNLQNIALGVQTEGLVVFGVNPTVQNIPQGRQFYAELIRSLRVLPGVESVTVMENRLGSWWSDNSDMTVDGKLPEVANGVSRMVRSNVAGPDFFHTLGIPVLAGRDFSDSDVDSAQHVGIINELFAQRFFPNQNPLGHTIGTDDGKYQMTVIGIVKNHKYRSMDESPIPMAWYNYAQIPMIGKLNVELRVHGEPLAILPAAQRVVQQLDPSLPIIEPTTQRAQFERTISQQTMFARLAECFGLLAIVLVATGLYGTLAYRVSMRTAEIGVRMAVGARRGQVVWMILRDSLLLTAIGVVAGIPLAVLAGRALSSSLYGVKPYDALSYVTAILGVALVALLASAIPARRAASIDPLTALRIE